MSEEEQREEENIDWATDRIYKDWDKVLAAFTPEVGKVVEEETGEGKTSLAAALAKKTIDEEGEYTPDKAEECGLWNAQMGKGSIYIDDQRHALMSAYGPARIGRLSTRAIYTLYCWTYSEVFAAIADSNKGE
jgi:hypothetical protein